LRENYKTEIVKNPPASQLLHNRNEVFTKALVTSGLDVVEPGSETTSINQKA